MAEPNGQTPGASAHKLTIKLKPLAMKPGTHLHVNKPIEKPAETGGSVREGSDTSTMHLKKVAPPELNKTPGIDVNAAAAPAEGSVREGSDTSTMRLKKVAPPELNKTPGININAAAAPAEGSVREGSDTSTMRLKKVAPPELNKTPGIDVNAAETAAPAEAAAPAAKASPRPGATSTMRLKITPRTPAAPAKPAATPAAASAQTIKLTTPAAAAPAAATIKLTVPQAPATSTIKLTTPQTPAAASVPETNIDDSRTVKLERPHRENVVSMQDKASSIPGAKQTIKLRPSTLNNGIPGVPSHPVTPGPVTGNAANRTIRMVPAGNGAAAAVPEEVTGTVKIPLKEIKTEVLSHPAVPHPAAAEPSAPTMKLTPPAPAAEPSAPTMKLTPPAPAAEVAASTMKLTPQQNAPSTRTIKLGGFHLPGKKDKEADKKTETAVDAGAAVKKETAAVSQTKSGIPDLILSIAAVLITAFTIYLMAAQYANMYHGKNVNVPGMTRLTGVQK